MICYASRALTPVETRYSQIEIEATDALHGCGKFHRYICGAEVIPETDHKPLIHILGNPHARLPARLDRLSLRLQPYRYTINHIAGDAKTRRTISSVIPSMPHLSTMTITRRTTFHLSSTRTCRSR